MKILVIDDHPLVVDALAQLLPQIDPTMDVLAAMDPREAIVVLDNEPDIALVLLDLALPGDGKEELRNRRGRIGAAPDLDCLRVAQHVAGDLFDALRKRCREK